MNDNIPPAPPFRPLPKIVAPQMWAPPEDALRVGDRVNILHAPHRQPFWRVYEVMVIDGDTCRLVTLDKRFSVNLETQVVKQLRDLQRRQNS